MSDVVALHALGLDGSVFAPLASEVGRLVVMPDLLGHGRESARPPWSIELMADEVAQGIADRGPAPVHLLGHSIGGVIAGAVAARLPERVASLTIVASAPRGVPAFADRAVAAEVDGLETQIEPTIERWFGPCFDPDAEVVRQARLRLEHMTPLSWSAAWRAFAAFAGFDSFDLGVVGGRTLCLSSTEDLSTPPSVVAEVAALIPGARHATVGRGGHLAILEHPGAYARVLEEHWHHHDPAGVVSVADEATVERNPL